MKLNVVPAQFSDYGPAVLSIQLQIWSWDGKASALKLRQEWLVYNRQVRPLKRLLRAGERISNWAGAARRDRVLAQIEQKIAVFRSESDQRMSRSHIGLKRRRQALGRRPYKDLSLLF